MRSSFFTILASMCVLLALETTPAAAQDRFVADEPLHHGMEAIRSLVVDHHTLITHRRLPVAMARSFATQVEQSVTAIRRDTRISNEARLLLDPLLTSIGDSAQTIGAGGDSIRQMDALFAMTKALEMYGHTFNEADWKPIQNR